MREVQPQNHKPACWGGDALRVMKEILRCDAYLSPDVLTINEVLREKIVLPCLKYLPSLHQALILWCRYPMYYDVQCIPQTFIVCVIYNSYGHAWVTNTSVP